MNKFSTQQIVALLRENVIFSGVDIFNGSEPPGFLDVVDVSCFDQGGVVVKKGDALESIILVLTGTVSLQTEGEPANGSNVVSVTSGGFVGETAIAGQTVSPAAVTADTECCIASIRSEDFWACAKEHPKVAMNIIAEMDRRNREVSTNVINNLLSEKQSGERYRDDLEKMVKEKEEQLHENNIQLMTIDRLSGLTTLAAGIAHEINNPLSFVKGSVGFIKKSVTKMLAVSQYWDDKPLEKEVLDGYHDYLSQINFDYMTKTLDEKFARIAKGIDRIILIVKNLRSFSRVDKESVSSIDVNQSIRETIEVLNSSIRKNVDFVTEFGELPLFTCCANEIHQCLLCVIQNAVDAVEDNGIIRVNTSYSEGGKQITIKVIDNGKGMPLEVVRNAMNPFFTTKPVGSGTGLGLTITEKIVVSHRGTINLSSSEGSGTTATMIFAIDNDFGIGK